MSDLRTAAQQALEAWDTRAGIDTASRAFEALRAALAQEPARGAWHDGVLEGQLRERERWLAHEREACERACEHQPHWVACVAAIRARGNT